MKIKKDKKTGKYYFNAYLGIEGGKPKRTTRRGFKTEREATIAYTKLITGQEEPKIRILFGEIYKDWLEEYQNTVEESTLQKTKSYFELHILPVFERRNIATITRLEIQKQVNEWARKNDLFHRLKSYLSRVFKYAIDSSIVKENPCSTITMPKRRKEKDPSRGVKENFFDREELVEFLKKAKEILPWMWYVYFHLLAYTGMRRAEGLALEWNDINFKAKTVQITKSVSKGQVGVYVGDGKTASSKRTISIDDKTIALLKEHRLQTESRLLFPNTKDSYITLSHPLQMLRKVTDKISIHGLRHTHCSLLFEAGASIAQVQQRLGHRDVTTTLGVYNHVTQKKSQEVAKLFSDYTDFDYQFDYQKTAKSIPFGEKRRKLK